MRVCQFRHRGWLRASATEKTGPKREHGMLLSVDNSNNREVRKTRGSRDTGTSFRRFLRSSQLRKPEDVRIRIRPARGRIPAMMRCSSGNDRHRRQIPLPERSHRRTGLRLNGCPIILMPSPGEFRQISSRNHDWRANTNEALHVGSRHLCSAMNSACNL